MLKAYFTKRIFNFKQPGGTSRGVLITKDSWFITVYDYDEPNVTGVGECSLLKGLSIDDRPDFESKIKHVCDDIQNWQWWLEEGLIEFPSIRFGLETAIKDFIEGGKRILFSSSFTDGINNIPINGLVWMGDYQTMRKRIIEKIKSGFNCIKLKVGALNFDDEVRLLKIIRNDFSENDIELRLDANGAFSATEVLDKLNVLSKFNIHSIEQPIKQLQWNEMSKVCSKSPIPVALDEELIGMVRRLQIREMLDIINPQYIILKPSLLGGFKQSSVFIEEAENANVGWWITSALESNIGLNAIAQWTYTLGSKLPQGLGTGQVFSDNITSPLSIVKATLHYNSEVEWNMKGLVDV